MLASIGVLMLGCGVIIWGSAGLLGITAGPRDQNILVTIHNTCVWLSALCHLAGVAKFRAAQAKGGQHLVDMRVGVRNIKFFCTFFCPFKNYVTGTNNLRIRAFGQMRKVNTRNASASDDTDADFFIAGFTADTGGYSGS